MRETPLTKALASCLLMAGLLALMLLPVQAQNEQKIIALVNDEPISAFDVSQRVRFMAASTRKQPDAAMRKQAISVLIDEALQLQEAKKQGIVVSTDQIKRSLGQVAKRNNMDVERLLQAFGQMGVKSKTIMQRIKANLAWRRVVQRKFRREVSIGATQVDRALSAASDSAGGGKTEKTEFQLQRVRLDLPKEPKQSTIVTRLMEAEQLRDGFKSCKTLDDLVGRVRRTSVRDVGRKASDQMPQPIRAFLMKAQAGQTTPPSVTSSSIEFYAVCNRRSVKSDSKQRRQVQAKLVEQEYQIRARRLLRDLRQDAFIEYR